MSKRTTCVYGTIFGLLIIATFFDLTLNQMLYHPENAIALFFENIIYLPILFVVPICGSIHYALTKKVRYVALAYAGFLYMGFDFFVIQSFGELFIMLTSMIFCECLLILLIYRLFSEKQLKGMIHFINFITIHLLITMLIVSLMKVTWGRVRYREFVDLSQFTPWYQINGINGYHSFPSGHTAVATVTLCLSCLSKEFPKYRYREKNIFYASLIFIGCMACSRMVLGAHYLSDTLMAFFVGFTVYNLLRRFFY